MKQYRRMTKQIGGIYIIQIVDFVLMFLFFVILTRTLSQSDYGLYSILNVTILFLIGMMGLGLSSFISRDLPGNKEETQKNKFGQIFTFALLINIIGVILVSLLGYIILNYISYNALILPMIMAILISSLIALGNLIAYYTYAKTQTIRTTFIDFMLRSAWTLPVMLLAVAYELSIDLIFLTKLIFTFIVLSSVIAYFKCNKLRFFNRMDIKYIKKALIFSLPLSTLIVSQWIITASDRYILKLFHSDIIVGKYSYIYSLLNYIFAFSIFAIVMTIYPYVVENFNKGNKEKSNFLINATFKYTIMIILPSLVGFFLLKKEIVTMVSGIKYINAIPIIPLLIIFPLAEVINSILRKILVLYHKTKTIAFIYLIGIIVNIVLNLLLIPKYHYFGAAIATSITYVILCIFFFIKTKEYLELDYGYIKLGKIAISTTIMAFSIIFIHPQNIYTKLMTILLGSIVYFLSLYITKAYVKEEIDLIKSFLPKNIFNR